MRDFASGFDLPSTQSITTSSSSSSNAQEAADATCQQQPNTSHTPNTASNKLLAAAKRMYQHLAVNRLCQTITPETFDPQQPLQLTDLLWATASNISLQPKDVFKRLRWGGQMVSIHTQFEQAQKEAHTFKRSGCFAIEQTATLIHVPIMGLRLPGITPKGYVNLYRKTRLTEPGQDTSRYTYQVQLIVDANQPESAFVRKQVPSIDELTKRLHKRSPQSNLTVLRRRATYLCTQALPVFLAREAETLEHLQKHLPQSLRHRIPKILAQHIQAPAPTTTPADKTNHQSQQTTYQGQGIQALDIQWLPPSEHSIDQLNFATQAAELLQALHEQAGVLHLDLRLDNIVISNSQVCFVDFGTAVRIDENLNGKPRLKSLIEEVLRNAAARRDLSHLLKHGRINQTAFEAAVAEISPHIDVFYLALQLARSSYPGINGQLIRVFPKSEPAPSIRKLTAAFLRPKNGKHADFKSAGDLLRGLKRIEKRFQNAA